MTAQETPIHISIVEYLRTVIPGALIWHTPNGGKRPKREAAELKRMGVMPGVFDISIVFGRRIYFLEVKTPKGRMSDTQEAFGVELDAQGISWGIVRSVDDARRALSLWGISTREAA